jgi:hypothetical protein
MGSDGHFFPSLGMGFHDFADRRSCTPSADSSPGWSYRPRTSDRS